MAIITLLDSWISNKKIPAIVVAVLAALGIFIVGGLMIYAMLIKRKLGILKHDKNVLVEKMAKADVDAKVAELKKSSGKAKKRLESLTKKVKKTKEAIAKREEKFLTLNERLSKVTSFSDIDVQ